VNELNFLPEATKIRNPVKKREKTKSFFMIEYDIFHGLYLWWKEE